jgi:putative transposase
MDERLRFVARLLDGEKMAALCREFDVSRKTGYKIFQRYKDCGLEGLTDRSRRPYRQANQLPFQIEQLIVRLKRERPSWGAPKIREKLRRLHSEIPTPGHQHRARSARSPWPDQPRAQTPLPGSGHGLVQALTSQ